MKTATDRAKPTQTEVADSLDAWVGAKRNTSTRQLGKELRHALKLVVIGGPESPGDDAETERRIEKLWLTLKDIIATELAAAIADDEIVRSGAITASGCVEAAQTIFRTDYANYGAAKSGIKTITELEEVIGREHLKGKRAHGKGFRQDCRPVILRVLSHLLLRREAEVRGKTEPDVPEGRSRWLIGAVAATLMVAGVVVLVSLLVAPEDDAGGDRSGGARSDRSVAADLPSRSGDMTLALRLGAGRYSGPDGPSEYAAETRVRPRSVVQISTLVANRAKPASAADAEDFRIRFVIPKRVGRRVPITAQALARNASHQPGHRPLATAVLTSTTGVPLLLTGVRNVVVESNAHPGRDRIAWTPPVPVPFNRIDVEQTTGSYIVDVAPTPDRRLTPRPFDVLRVSLLADVSGSTTPTPAPYLTVTPTARTAGTTEWRERGAASAGQSVRYRLLVTNHGHAPARQVTVRAVLARSMSYFPSSARLITGTRRTPLGPELVGHGVNIGTIPPAQERVVVMRGQLPPHGRREVPLTAVVRSRETSDVWANAVIATR